MAVSAARRMVSTAPGPFDVAATAGLIPAISTDGSTYPIEKLDAHRRAVKHLAISVFVFSDDKLLLQRRADGKYHCGGMWANTCCTHPHWNESVAASAVRRLREEMGLTLDLQPTTIIEYEARVSNDLKRCRMLDGRHLHRSAKTLSPILTPTRPGSRSTCLAGLNSDFSARPGKRPAHALLRPC